MPALQAPPEASLDREWRTLARKLELAKGFCFIVYFVDDERPARALKATLVDSLRSRAAHLIDIDVEVAPDFAAQSLSRLFEASALPTFQQAHAAFWIEAIRGAGLSDWDAARRDFLMRLNERRSRIEEEIRCPLILLLPANWQREAAALAPDMWHVRVHSAPLLPLPKVPVGMAVETDRALALRPLAAHVTTGFSSTGFGRPQAYQVVASSGTQVRGDSSAVELPVAVAHWQSVLKQSAATQSPANAKLPVDESTVQLAALWDGFAAVDAWLERGRPELAQPLAEQVLGLARQRAAAADTTSPALRELSVSLEKVGDVASAQGRLDAAARAYEECLDIDLRLLHDSGESLSALHDLSVTLEKVGNAAFSQGRLDVAARSYHESLNIRRRLAREGGEPLSALRDLSLSLEKVGDVASAQGRLDEAARAYDECLDIDRRLLLEGGESPLALRDLSVTLDKIGDVASAQGRLDAAARAYDGSLDIERRVLREGGESPPALRDLSVSLIKVGDVASAQGRLDASARAYEESLNIVRRRVRDGGETPQNLDDLAIGLLRVAMLDGADADVRRAAGNEALSLYERLVRVYPDLPFYSDRLNVARRILDELSRSKLDNIDSAPAK